ncbi:midasin [Laetiporus sulphureus 93-53]|uniref:Midasin n=1 Tax=Laetiporus sulphureus 93-53 TaxID=1314785 RepID=A0A165FMX5_9APHY|nr:midasin [Laetiporus sulphureus 93-53]KZT09211.1 midasin [Laetiporus sulphureus 93-53]
MASSIEISDPLTMNLQRQTRLLLSQFPADSPHSAAIQNVSTNSELLNVLSHLLLTPGLTELVATAFRPLLVDLCARWLQNDQNEDDKFEAFCFLLELHPEIYPIFSVFLRHPGREGGPLAFVMRNDNVQHIGSLFLHRRLLGYYRILQANREVPRILLWSLSPLSKLIWAPHPDNGVRFLSIRCYALQSGMMEGERMKMEKKLVGDVAKVDSPIAYGANVDGSPVHMDGWILPGMEANRITNARNAHLKPQNYFSFEGNDSREPIHPAELSPLVVNVHGVLMFRSSKSVSQDTTLIETPTAVQSLRTLAIHHSLHVPTLLTSAPSSGKSLLLSHLASTLYPDAHNQIVTIHLADTSLDARSLLGSYASSSTRPGAFEWREGVLVRAMREGKWVVFEDIDRASNEVLGVIKPLVESLRLDKWIGGRAYIEIPNRGTVIAEDSFAIYATRSVSPSRNGTFASPTFFGVHKFHEMIVSSPTPEDLRMIVDTKYPRLAGVAARGFIRMWEAIKALGPTSSIRDVGLRELDKLCTRAEHLLPTSSQSMDIDLDVNRPLILPIIFPNPTVREDLYLEARDVFFGAGATTASARAHMDAVAAIAAEHLGLSPERRDWLLRGHAPEFEVEKDVNGRTTAVRVGRTRLRARAAKGQVSTAPARPFAMHRPAVQLLSRIATAVSLCEPVLLTGETGTGKTSAVTHLAALLNRPLVSLNLSNQTESSDLIGGFKPVDARVPGTELHARFAELFEGTFSRKKNAKFQESVRKAVLEGKWKRAVGLWREALKLARGKIQARETGGTTVERGTAGMETPRKRRKTEHDGLNVSEASWIAFEEDVQAFEVQHVQGNSKFAFAFVEGLLIKALRNGDWILLDEINLATPETLECISALLHSRDASITLTEQGAVEPVPRHPDFRLFACMNPATDVGKKDLPPNIRSRFTELDVPSPDADKQTLLSIVDQYIGGCAVGDRGAVMDVAEFYAAVKRLADERKIADGANHRPHYNMRTLARALTYAADLASTYSLRRALWEGCLMAFTMVLDEPSAAAVTALAQQHILAGVRNPKSLLTRVPVAPHPADAYIKFGAFYLERGPLPEDPVENYIMTPSVETKLVDLARIIAAKRYPVLIEGPTSSGKTSSIEYLAKRTGHRFVRINNHEHTDIQEYLGTYVSDPMTGKLVFKDGLLVRALRNGDWIVLDELNLAPTDVLEALNRLLDDNRELVIPETQEVVRPHPHFRLFATQNPPGLYAGRKVLSRAFRNRFLEVHFEDVPQTELETILCQRCRIAPSHGQRIVSVFQELQKRRQSGRVFESKNAFATLRDLFRWAQRDAINYQELAENGYMLLAERARRADDKIVVKEVIESIMKVRIDDERLYNLQGYRAEQPDFLGCPIPAKGELVWTSAMQRLFVLLARALRFNEPVLLVGETGCGKTSVCQLYASILSRTLRTVNCHQNTETADLIGGLRPIRNRAAIETDTLREALFVLQKMGIDNCAAESQALISAVDGLLKSTALDASALATLRATRLKLQRLSALFEWHDGPLIEAMRQGDIFLLDEISLADDSVLERLNSVLEPERTIVLAERGGDNLELPSIRAVEGFKLVATMNPGGDYGKKELSPALRNRFTEIWVPPLTDRRDIQCIVESLWQHESLQACTSPLLEFVEWLCAQAADRSVVSIRDIIAWVNFTNAVFATKSGQMPASQIFHHAARMTFIDGLNSLPQFSSYSWDSMEKVTMAALGKLQELIPVVEEKCAQSTSVHQSSSEIHIGSFSIPRGPEQCVSQQFSFLAPTTRDNAMRVVRACQLPKPVLLEGSPGVGKTSLISAIASICGYELCRINLSDQTDLVDLFGSDLPVEGGDPGQFAWKDADFLKALQEGRWVLLDEMNLAPQAILEGLNAVLDHRGTVYIPELGRSFTRHPSFRIFAAQNPLHQGGGRKGLPKSFLNRFTKVFVQELTADDMLVVCKSLHPDISDATLRPMISYTAQLNEEIMVKRAFAREGSPWEFNLRDVIRWATLLQRSGPNTHPAQFLSSVFLERFRNVNDRRQARLLFDRVFADSSHPTSPSLSVSPEYLRAGNFFVDRVGCCLGHRAGQALQACTATIESVGTCISNNWLAILTGSHGTGKTALVRLMAHLCGKTLKELAVNSATDAADLLGGYEEIDIEYRILALVRSVLSFFDAISCSTSGSKIHATAQLDALEKIIHANRLTHDVQEILANMSHLLSLPLDIPEQSRAQRDILLLNVTKISNLVGRKGQLEWVDGPLVTALKEGCWLVLDGANLCNPSVLDRLNSLCEPNGVLTLNERGQFNGKIEIIKPHPEFKLFMCMDPQFGELSRAMRNRGIEISLVETLTEEDRRRVLDHLHLPAICSSNVKDASLLYEIARRGTCRRDSVANMDDWSSGRLIGEDSPNAWVTRTALSLNIRQSLPTLEHRSVTYFAANSMVPNFSSYISRWIALPSPIGLADHAQTIMHLIRSLFSSDSSRAIRQLLQSQCSRVPDSCHGLLPYEPLESQLPDDRSEFVAEDLLMVLRLLVTLLLDKEDDRLHGDESRRVHEHRRRSATDHLRMRAADAARLLLEAMHRVGQDRIEHIDAGPASVDIAVMARLLSFAFYLRAAALGKSFDYSSVQVLLRWVSETLRNGSPMLADIESHVDNLSRIVCPTSGVALADIWSSLADLNIPRNIQTYLIDLEAAVLGSSILDERSEALDLMALWTSPERSSKTEQRKLVSLSENLLLRLSTGEPPIHMDVHRVDALALMAELTTMYRLAWHWNSQLTESAKDAIHQFIRYGSRHLKMSRLVPYRQLLWISDMNTNGSAEVLLFARAHQQWLETIWDLTPVAQARGPSILFLPVELHESVMNEEERSLKHLRSLECSLLRRSEFYLAQLAEHDVTRATQVTILLLQSMLMIAACLEDESSMGDHGDLIRVLPGQDLSRSILITLAHLEKTPHEAFGTYVHQHLRPALKQMHHSHENSSPLLLTDVGKCWIALGRALLGLYVPNTPIDPAAMQQFAKGFWQDQITLLSAQLRLHLQFNSLMHGHSSSPSTHFLQGLLHDAELCCEHHALYSHARGDLARLHSFWAEVLQVMSQVIPPAKVDSIIADLTNGQGHAISRESLLQESLAAFLQRLRDAYPDYLDISGPIHLAILYMKLGLRLVADGVKQTSISVVAPLAEALVAFPSVRSVDLLLRCHSLSSTLPIASSMLSTSSTGIALNVSLGMGLADVVPMLQILYEQIYGLWSVDRARREDAERQAQSLYRQSTTEHKPISDADLEEQEFLSLFPQFDHTLDPDATGQAATKKLTLGNDCPSMVQIGEIHCWLFDKTASASSALITTLFVRLRRLLIPDLLDGELESMPETLDLDSHPFRLALLQERIASLRGDINVRDKAYSFYLDANVPEVRKAVGILHRLQDRLQSLIQEWPDQMVLQHLHARCESLLDLESSSPIARVISATEQLVLQMEDWEMYSNRDNTLKAYQQELVSLVVEWRRLELSSWRGLLQTEAHKFSVSAHEWWYKLYEAIVHGVTAAASEEQKGSMDALSQYLDSLVPLLDDFLTSGPLGEYQSRFQLLSSFGEYTKQLTVHHWKWCSAMKRVQRIVEYNQRYYGQFVAKVKATLDSRQTEFEKEVADYIKLASWKDINVLALKQSAQRSHKQLYKVIRKFREALRQPVNEYLDLRNTPNVVAEQHAIVKDDAFPRVPLDLQLAGFSSSMDISPHLANLCRTYGAFQQFIADQVKPCIQSISPSDVDELTDAIATTSKALSKTAIPHDIPTDQRNKLAKSLLNRKRRAWSDLLKELKRIGFSTNAKPEVLEHMRNPRQFREQNLGGSTSPDAHTAARSGDYLYRVAHILPRLRLVMGNHHQDLTTREVQRGVMLVESGFAMGVESRVCIMNASQTLERLSKVVSRLCMLTHGRVVSSGATIAKQVSIVHSFICKVRHALGEILHDRRYMENAVSGEVTDELRLAIETSSNLQERLSQILVNIHLSATPILLEDEHKMVKEAQEHLTTIIAMSCRWAASQDPINAYARQLHIWLQDYSHYEIASVPYEQGPDGTPALIDVLLIRIQEILAICPKDQDSSTETRNGFIRHDCELSIKMTRTLGLDVVLSQCDAVLNETARCSKAALQQRLSRILPFLVQFMDMAKEQLLRQSAWTNSLLKLEYVACSVILSVAREGFCRPPDVEESDSGEGDVEVDAEGTGVGEGKGMNDVSKEIQDENQVEGLKGEEEDVDEETEAAQDGAIEMSDNVDARLQDVAGSDHEEEDDDDEDDAGPEEQVGDLDASSDPAAVDEKLWGDESGPSEPERGDGKTNEDHSRRNGESEIVAKEDETMKEATSDKGHDAEAAPKDTDAEPEEDIQGDGGEPQEDENGEPLDEFIPDTNILDLPDDMNFDAEKERPDQNQDENDMDMGKDTDGMEEETLEQYEEGEDAPQMLQDDLLHAEEETADGTSQVRQEDAGGPDAPPDETKDHTTAAADLHAGDGVNDGSPQDASGSPSHQSALDQGTSAVEQAIGAGKATACSDEQEDSVMNDEMNGGAEAPQDERDHESTGENASISTQSHPGGASSRAALEQTSRSSLRNLGDVLRDVSRRFDDIMDTEGLPEEKAQNDVDDTSQMQYSHPDSTIDQMQALGPAPQDQAAKLDELSFSDGKSEPNVSMTYMETEPQETQQSPDRVAAFHSERSSQIIEEGTEKAMTKTEIRSRLLGTESGESSAALPSTLDMVSLEEASKDVESKLREWQASGQPSECAGDIWRLYESLTHDLSYALCEQLRLILEPTQATRLKGDYRTGKRLNMKKIIPYIASEFTKDKIWLRRTRPSQREYQVLIALDDSKSMAESHSVHLAYETLALVSKALSRLEVGDIAIAKFGETVDVLHAFDGGPFTDQAGTKVIDAFRFDQKATQVLSLVETSLQLLEQARERRTVSSATASDLWQLEIIISDGICQDHETLRTVLRKAEEQRVMVVFVILDSLHTKSSADGESAIHNSILSMTNVAYRNVDGRMDIQMERYLDTFPFEYYVVLRDVEALPDVLSGTLQQFFERVAES